VRTYLPSHESLRQIRDLSTVLVTVAVLSGCTGGTRDSNEATAPFAGRTVRLVVGVSAGGGQDLYARVMAPYLGKHLPGEPNVIVENMTGAGGLVLMNYLARRADPNGLTVALVTSQAITAQLLNRGGDFDIREMPLVGSPAGDGYACVFGRETGMTLDSWRRGRIPRMGTLNPTTPLASYAFLVSDALALPIRPISGHAGVADVRAAIGSGEVDGLCMSRDGFAATFEPKEDYVALLQAGGDPASHIPGVPVADDLVTSRRGKVLLGVADAIAALARLVVLPPHTPAPIVAAMRTAFEQTMADPAFLAAARSANIALWPRYAAELDAQMRALLSPPDEFRDDVLKSLGRGEE